MINVPTNTMFTLKYANCIKKSILRRSKLLIESKKHYASALYISGHRASNTFSYINPYLDIEDRFKNIDKLKHNLTLRRLDVDIDGLQNVWQLYKSLDGKKSILENKQTEIAKHLSIMKKENHLDGDKQQEFDKLITHLKIIKEDLKALKETVWEMEDSFVVNFLNLPNTIDPRTETFSKILKQYGEVSNDERKNHLDVAKDLGLLEFKNPMEYYFSKDAASFELGLLKYIGKLLTEHDLLRVVGTDFCRSTIVEASGVNHEDPNGSFILEDFDEIVRNTSNRMHLVGGASLPSFLVMHTKQLINPNKFPLRYFAIGKQYTPLPETIESMGLFNVCQAAAAHVFLMVKDQTNEEYISEFDKMIEITCNLYSNICNHYRVVKRSASELTNSESLRVSFELWSNYYRRYIEVGHISAYGNYLNQKLLIAYQTPTGRDFPSIISGTILSVPKLLACLLENHCTDFVIPSKILEYIPSQTIA